MFIVAFSGGHSSALVAIETVRKYGKNNVVLLNHDISSHVEHQDIKRFKEDISNYCDVPITYANAPDFENTPPLEVCKKIGGFKSSMGLALCTYELKTKQANKYYEENFPVINGEVRSDVKILFGFDKNEEARITRRVGVMAAKGYMTDYPLAFWDRTIEKTEDIGIRRPSTYRIFKHANCLGCLKAGRQHWYCVYCMRPDIFEEAKQAESEIGHGIIKDDVFVSEFEPKFKEMKEDKHICPTDKTDPNTFWAMVNKAIPEQETFLPCDCSL